MLRWPGTRRAGKETVFGCRGGRVRQDQAALPRPRSGSFPLHRSREAGGCCSSLWDSLGASNPPPRGFEGWELCVLRGGPAPLGEWLGGGWLPGVVPMAAVCSLLLSPLLGCTQGSPQPLPGWYRAHSPPSQLALHPRSPCPGAAAHCAFLAGTATPSPPSPVALHSAPPAWLAFYAEPPAQSALCPWGCTPTAGAAPPKSCSCTSNICPCTPGCRASPALAPLPRSPIPHPACSHEDPEAVPALGHPKSSSRVKRGCAGPGRASPGREGSLSAGGARRGGRNASGRAAGQVATAPGSADPTRGSGREQSPGTGLAAGMGHPMAQPL